MFDDTCFIIFTCKQYAERLSNTKAAMYISIIGNVLNIILNYALIYGKWGVTRDGLYGFVWACLLRVVLGISFYGMCFIIRRQTT
ncbi:MAG: polysaccharide biosynthesis C-terminal domain-containing protein [Sphingobacteriaceae bacterium]|nr:polysaccharide biosynthesis C-terminal domain-containing protein [Sphingobacteriaceae bacterium]